MKPSQKSLKKWTKQNWRTKSGKNSTQGSKATGERYLPAKAIKSLSNKEYAATTAAKRKGTKIGKLTVDSTARGMSKFMGTDEEIAEQEMDEEMNFRKGGMPSKKTYGMRAGGFTKRGGMYKKGY